MTTPRIRRFVRWSIRPRRFEITYAGVKTVLHDFDGADGSGRRGDLTEVGGILYGVASFGGANYGGTLFRVTP